MMVATSGTDDKDEAGESGRAFDMHCFYRYCLNSMNSREGIVQCQIILLFN